jgi:ABC-type sugar transport systems, permease components
MRSLYRKANIMYVPALILFAVFVIYPFLDGIRIAFTNWNGYSQHFKYVGLLNFKRLFIDDNIRTAFVNTLLYSFGSTFFQQLLGLSFALLLNESFPGRTATRAIIYLPIMISAVIMGYMWIYLIEYGGAVNDIVTLLGYKKILWLSNANLAGAVIILANTLQFVGVSMIIYLAGLQGIPAMYYEAASIEGAGSWVRFRHITLPLLYPSFVTSVTINLIGGMKLFDVIRALTGGGPGYKTHSLATLIHSSYFSSQNAGYAAAIGVFLFVVILFFTLMLQLAFRGREVQYT